MMPEGKQLRFLSLFAVGILGAYLLYAHLGTLILLGIPTLGGLAFTYNKMQAKAHQIREAHSNVTICMKKRVDLTNKLIDIASGYGDMEKLTHITVAQTESVQAAISASQEVDGAVNRIMSMARAYPDLKANVTYQNLMNQLESIENDLQNKREIYNGRVRSYNTACTSIPTVFVAPYLGFKSAPYFDVENADSLAQIKDFHSNDGEALKNILSNVSNKIASTSGITSPEIDRVEQNLLKQSEE
jgi:LemA protein